MEQFIPAADEVEKLQRGKTSAARFFRKFASRHFDDLRTTQGTYIVTPSGTLLGFDHVLEPAAMKAFLTEGLNKWEALTPEDRLGADLGERGNTDKSQYPEDGLVLSVVLRKTYEREPRTARELRGVVEWNKDFAWFRKDEARQFLSDEPTVGERFDVPSSLITRVARFNFTDTVRAFADSYPSQSVKAARLTSTVVGIEGSTISLRFEGEVKLSQDDVPLYGHTKIRIPRNPTRGYDATLYGYATFDLETSQFESFELVSTGDHHGGGKQFYNSPATLGIVMTLAGDRPMDRVEPLHLKLYGW